MNNFRPTLETTVANLELALKAKVIYNSEYNDHKHRLSSWSYTAKSKGHDAALNIIGRPYNSRDYPLFDKAYWLSPNSFLRVPIIVRQLTDLANKTTGKEYDAIVAIRDSLEPFSRAADLMGQLKPFIKKGRRPSENPRVTDPRTFDNTGTCSVCNRNVKLHGRLIVDHGFTIEWSGRMGRCFGVNHEPIETSVEGAKAYLELLIRTRDGMKQHLANRESWEKVDGPTERGSVFPTMVGRDHKDWLHYFLIAVRQLENQITLIGGDITFFTKKVDNWKPSKLPGDPSSYSFKHKVVA